MNFRGIVIAALALGACGTPLLGGECAPGYAENEGACVALSDGSGASSGSASASSGSGGSPCSDGLVVCDGACVDLATDAAHCGDCATACAGPACVAGACQLSGDLPGQAILIGMDFSTVTPSDPMAKLLGNAVFTATHTPVRILDYRELSEWNAASVTNTVDLIADEAVARGRTLQTAVAKGGAEVPALLASHDYDVFVVHDLDAAPAGAPAALGEGWASPLEKFASGGGVVVIIGTAGGAGEMPAFLASSGLFLTTSVASAAGKLLSVTSDDAIGAGLGASLPALPGASAFLLGSGGPTAASVVSTTDLASVVLHRVWPLP